MTFNPGADGLRLGKQYSEFGLKGKMAVLDIYGTIVYEPNLPQLGDGTLGMYSSLFYSPLIKSPENERFVAEFRRGWAVAGQRRAERLCRCARHRRCDQGDQWRYEDKLKFIAALKAVKFPSPKGDISLDKYGQVIQSMYIREVEKVDGQLGNAPIASYPNIDQFWPFTEAEFAAYKYSYKELKGSLGDCGKLLAKK